MSFRNLIIVIILAIVLVGAIAGEGYFYFYSQKQNNAVEAVIQSIQNSLNAKQSVSALAQAEGNLQAQTEKLEEMQADFPSSPVLDAAIEKDLSAAAAAAAKADSLAADPKLGLTTQTNIIALGQEAAQALAYLESLEKTPASTSALNDAAENAIELVSAYINELSNYIDGLTPANSGLTLSEIAAYKSEVDELISGVDSAETSLNEIDTVPASSVLDITSTSTLPLIISNSNSNDNNSIGSISSNGSSNNSTNSSSSTPYTLNPTPSTNNQENNSDNGSITLGDIINQENIVSQDTNEVDQLSNQDNSNASSSDSSNNSSSSDDNSGDNNGNNDGANNGGDNGSGIQSQGGPVKLIQGENTF